MAKIPFYRPSIGPEEIDEVIDTLKSGWLTTGPKTKQFESEFGAYLKQKHAVAVNSCTAALHLALEAIDLKPRQGVLVPTMTFAATAEVVRYLGCDPILVDCLPDDFNLDVADAEQKIQSALAAGRQVAAVMPVHYGGQIADVAAVQALARRHHLKIVEDAAHCCPAYYRIPGSQDDASAAVLSTPHSALGASHSSDDALARESPTPQSALRTPHSAWLPVGSSADISCFSFYANKTITTGEGGMACTQNDEYADRMRIMSLHGISRDAWKRYMGEGSWYYEIVAPGFKYNLTDIAAAIGIHQLRKADAFLRSRTEIAQRYGEVLNDVEEIILPRQLPNRVHSWHLYVIRLKLDRLKIDRAQFIAELHQRGVSTSVHWMPLHMHPYYRDTYGYAPQDFPTAAAVYPEIITLPLYPGMSEADITYVCDSVRNLVAGNRRIPVSGVLHHPPHAASQQGTDTHTQRCHS